MAHGTLSTKLPQSKTMNPHLYWYPVIFILISRSLSAENNAS